MKLNRYRYAIRDIPQSLREEYRLSEHMRKRPRKIRRHRWVERWLATLPATTTVGVDRPVVVNEPKRRPVHYDKAASDAFLWSQEWRQLRMRVLTTRGARCECCGASPKDGVTVINVDHIKPRRLYPELALTEANLQVLCAVCNHGKGNWDETDWRSDDARNDMTVAEAARIAEKYCM